ncbi:M23 family metallopeptidase [Streptomyces albireticuli]|uniref:M23 family metallopeptidase n=1 Tax=Streptomyces albireticuli TaxID=1940 RepID=UPI003695FB82
MPAYVDPEDRAEPEQAPGPVAAGPAAPASTSSFFSSSASARGRHRVAKQRGGTMARSGAVLGVGVMAAVGAGGMASAQDRPPAPISVPDLSGIPGVGAFMSKGDAGAGTKGKAAADSGRAASEAAAAAPGADQPLTRAGLSAEDVARGTATAGEALRARILQQAEYQQNAADDEARDAKAWEAAEAQREAARERAEEVRAAEAEARKAAEAEKAAESQAKEEKEHASSSSSSEESSGSSSRASSGSSSRSSSGSGSGSGTGARSGSYSLPVGSYTLTAGFGQAGGMWSANHTGEDFAAPTGTPVKAVGGGTITQAGWAGAYGYRIVLRLDDGTELWFCHLSSMVVTSGKVAAGDVIGRVGATGNVTGPHLHLEVRPGGGGPVAPLSWLRARGLQP